MNHRWASIAFGLLACVALFRQQTDHATVIALISVAQAILAASEKKTPTP